MHNFETIPEGEQRGFIETYWRLLAETEALADNNNDAFLQRLVEGAYQQWNRVTGQDHKPRWQIRK